MAGYVITIDGADYIDWPKVGRGPYHVPADIPTEVELCVTAVTSLVAAYGDPAIDPRSGGVIGQQEIAAQLLLTTRQARRTILHERFVMWVGDLPATCVATLSVWDAQHQAQNDSKWAQNGRRGGRPVTNCSAGSNVQAAGNLTTLSGPSTSLMT